MQGIDKYQFRMVESLRRVKVVTLAQGDCAAYGPLMESTEEAGRL